MNEIIRYAGTIIGRRDDDAGVFCIVTFKEFEGDYYIPVDHFEGDKIGYGQPVYAVIEEDDKLERHVRLITRIAEMTPEREESIKRMKELLDGIPGPKGHPKIKKA